MLERQGLAELDGLDILSAVVAVNDTLGRTISS
jgi:hypothetical protein